MHVRSMLVTGLCGLAAAVFLAPAQALAGSSSNFERMYCVVDPDPSGPTCNFQVMPCGDAVESGYAALVAGPVSTAGQAEDLAQVLASECQALLDLLFEEEKDDSWDGAESAFEDSYCVVDADPFGLTCNFQVVPCGEAVASEYTVVVEGPLPLRGLAVILAEDLASECRTLLDLLDDEGANTWDDVYPEPAGAYCIVDPDPLGPTCDFQVVPCGEPAGGVAALVAGPVSTEEQADDLAEDLVSECKELMGRFIDEEADTPELCIWTSSDLSDCSFRVLACSGAEAPLDWFPVEGPFSDADEAGALAEHFEVRCEETRRHRVLDPCLGSPAPGCSLLRA